MYSSVQSLTFGQFAHHVFHYLPLRSKTRENYHSKFRVHLDSQLGDIPLSDISRSHIQEVLSGLSPQTKISTLSVLKTIFREAVKNGLIENSPTAELRVPTPIVKRKKFLLWEELRDAELGKYRSQIHFLALHGLRWGEAVVLTRADIQDGLVHINKSIHGSTKSQSGVRVVPLISDFVPFPKSPKTLRKVLKPLGIQIHSLRHTYAYILKAQGVHVTTAQKLLGHSDVKGTLKVYTQVLDDEILAAGELIRQIK